MTESLVLSLGLAAAAGLFSFVSPCVLPLIPTYMTYLTGASTVPTGGAEEGPTTLDRRALYGNAAAFILGFSAVFVAFGATASAVGQFLRLNSPVIRRLAGLLIIAFGLHLMGVLRWQALEQTRRWDYRPSPGTTPVSALLLGASFAAGWTACIGPVLSSILVLAAQRQTIVEGVVLLSAYAAGLAVPFALVAVFLERAIKRLRRLKPYLPWIETAAGLLLIGVGVMVYTNYFAVLSGVLAWPF